MNIVASETLLAQRWLANLVNEAELNWITPVPSRSIPSWSQSDRTAFNWMSLVTTSPTERVALPHRWGSPHARKWEQLLGLKTSSKPAEVLPLSSEVISSKADRDKNLVLVSSQGDVESTETLGDMLACYLYWPAAEGTTPVVSGLGKNAYDTSRKVFVFPQHMSPCAQLRPYSLDSNRRGLFLKTHAQSKTRNTNKQTNVRSQTPFTCYTLGGI